MLGQGGMGSVWRAEHLGLRAPVAIKLMDAAIAENQEALSRFHREAQAAAALRSPHVVQILDYGLDPDLHAPFIAMELLEGEDLRQRLLRAGRLSPQAAAGLVTHVARALARAHEAGIVHRDLKPENVFLVRNEDEEVAKVLDFGISKISELALTSGAPTRTGSVMGTPFYMSPEQIVGSKTVDYRTDLWALGVIAFECLLGVRPFSEETVGGLAVQICTQSPPRPSERGQVPPGFDAWFEKALAREPSTRFQSARELAEALRAVCGAREVSGNIPATVVGGPPLLNARTTSPLSRTTHDPVIPMRRASSPLLLVALGALSLGGLAAWLLFWPRAAEAPRSETSLSSAPSALASAAPIELTPTPAPSSTAKLVAAPAAPRKAPPAAAAVPAPALTPAAVVPAVLPSVPVRLPLPPATPRPSVRRPDAPSEAAPAPPPPKKEVFF